MVIFNGISLATITKIGLDKEVWKSVPDSDYNFDGVTNNIEADHKKKSVLGGLLSIDLVNTVLEQRKVATDWSLIFVNKWTLRLRNSPVEKRIQEETSWILILT
ncbi:hypothetical protein VTP01DRAFT_823 [Rhizomucor pusillus]|uniref:uncharacterized protein n=1 Tax=Rhizomucor pusillus TaxID=4840 RepID=UPI0037435910